MRFPLVMDGMRLSLKNVKRVFLTAIALHNFVLNTGGGYFEVPDVDTSVTEYDPDAEGVEDEEQTAT